MQAKVEAVAQEAGVQLGSVTITYNCEDFDGDGAVPWIIRIRMVKGCSRKSYSYACGFGLTIDEAAAEAILDIKKWESIGYRMSHPIK